MSTAFRTLSIAALLAPVAPAWAHPGHPHESLAHALIHLMFGLHGWPTLLAWLVALTAAVATAFACRALWRARLARRARTARPGELPARLV
jgi:hypothetical protein